MEQNSLLPGAFAPLETPTYDGSGQCVHPDVVRVNKAYYNSHFIMTMEPYPFGDDRLENPSILCSDDGITWGIPAGLVNPIAPEPSNPKGWNSDGDLLVTPKGLSLFYRYNSSYGETTCLSISSADGFLWSKPSSLFSFPTSGRFASPALSVHGDLIMMYFVDTIDQTINVSSSRDGKTWTFGSRLFHFTGAWHIDVTTDRKWTYILINDKECIYLVRSEGRQINWHVLTDKGWSAHRSDGIRPDDPRPMPIVCPSSVGWDDGFIYRSSCLIENNQIQAWYNARSNGNQWRVGYASGSVPE